MALSPEERRELDEAKAKAKADRADSYLFDQHYPGATTRAQEIDQALDARASMGWNARIGMRVLAAIIALGGAMEVMKRIGPGIRAWLSQ